jgi:3-oxoacyl-[acyl-carrier protein] reductase
MTTLLATGRHIRGPAVVTGGGQGLGRTFALALAQEGVPVIVADQAGDRAASVAAEIVVAGGRALAVTVDVSDEASVVCLAERVLDAYGAPAVLVNNAAIFSTLAMGPFTEIDTATWERVMRVNVTGTWLCCRALVPAMVAAGYGKVVNISSATVWTGRAGYLHYVTSKAALIGMTRALAAEVGPDGVRVNALTPGSTETEVERATITREAREAMASSTALRRVQVPADLVGAVLFLSSTDSDFMTGQTVNVDGGLAFH